MRIFKLLLLYPIPLAAFFRLLLLLGSLLLAGRASRAAGPGSPADTAQVWQALQQSRRLVQTDTGQAGAIARQALARSRVLGFAEGLGLAQHLLGQLRARQGQYPAAVALYRQAEQQLLARYRAHPTPRVRVLLGTVANSLGAAEWDQGHRQEALVAYLRAEDYYTEHDYDGLVVLYNNLSDCYKSLEQPAQQLAYLRRSIALRTRPLQHPEHLVMSYVNLALLLTEQGHRPEAWQYLEQARHVLAQPAAAPYRAAYERVRGIYFFENGEYPQAQASFRRALAEVQRQGNAKRTADIYLALGRIARQLGHYAAADTALRQGLRLARAQQNLPQQALLLALLADLEEAQGSRHAPAALAYFKQMKAL